MHHIQKLGVLLIMVTLTCVAASAASFKIDSSGPYDGPIRVTAACFPYYDLGITPEPYHIWELEAQLLEERPDLHLGLEDGSWFMVMPYLGKYAIVGDAYDLEHIVPIGRVTFEGRKEGRIFRRKWRFWVNFNGDTPREFKGKILDYPGVVERLARSATNPGLDYHRTTKVLRGYVDLYIGTLAKDPFTGDPAAELARLDHDYLEPMAAHLATLSGTPYTNLWAVHESVVLNAHAYMRDIGEDSSVTSAARKAVLQRVVERLEEFSKTGRLPPGPQP